MTKPINRFYKNKNQAPRENTNPLQSTNGTQVSHDSQLPQPPIVPPKAVNPQPKVNASSKAAPIPAKAYPNKNQTIAPIKEKEPKEEKIKTDVIVQSKVIDQENTLFIPEGHSHFYIGFTMSYAVKNTIFQAVSQCVQGKKQEQKGWPEAGGDWYEQSQGQTDLPSQAHQAVTQPVVQSAKLMPISLLSFAVFDLGIRPIVHRELIRKAMQKLSPKYAAIKMLFKAWHVDQVDGYHCLSLELKDRYQIFEILKEELGGLLFNVGFETEAEDARIFCAYSKSEIIPPSQLPMHSITINQLSLFQRPAHFHPEQSYEIVYSTILPKDLPVPSYEEPKVDDINADILQRLEENLKSKQIQPKKHRRHKLDKNADITIDKELV
jgi:hypothetical protein